MPSFEAAVARDENGGPQSVESSSDDLTVEFFDIRSFDRTLSAKLRGEPQTVSVRLHAPATVNGIPEQLGKWLSMVEKYEGTVELQADPDYRTRGIVTGSVSLVLGALISAYKAIENKLLYGPNHIAP